MAAGDLINYAKTKAIIGTSWGLSSTIEYPTGTKYLCASSFILRLFASSWGLFASASVNVTAYYYNGSGWTTAFSGSVSASANVGEKNTYLYHNTSSGSTSGDNANYHLWKIVVSNSSSGSNQVCKLIISAGGLEHMTESNYNSYFKGKKIKYCWHALVDSGTESSFLTNNRPSHFRGTKITNALARAVCATNID